MMEKYFKRKSEKKLDEIKQKIAKANDAIKILEMERFNESEETFCGNRIISEEEEKSIHIINYHIGVRLSSMNVRVDVHPDSISLGKTYLVTLSEYGINDISSSFIDGNYPRTERGIETFEDAKKIGLTWLKDLIEIDNVDN